MTGRERRSRCRRRSATLEEMALSALEQMALASFRDEVRRMFDRRVTAVSLFGSRARGEGRADSDLDILVLVDDVSREERNQIIDVGADVSLAHGLVLSPLVRPSGWLGAGSPLAREIMSDGVPV